MGPVAVVEARRQLAELIELVEDRANRVTSLFLNHHTHNDAARRELLDFLAALEVGLSTGSRAS